MICTNEMVVKTVINKEGGIWKEATMCYLKMGLPSSVGKIFRKISLLHNNRNSTLKKVSLHGENLHDLYSLPHIIRMIKSRSMRWVGYVAWT